MRRCAPGWTNWFHFKEREKPAHKKQHQFLITDVSTTSYDDWGAGLVARNVRIKRYMLIATCSVECSYRIKRATSCSIWYGERQGRVDRRPLAENRGDECHRLFRFIPGSLAKNGTNIRQTIFVYVRTWKQNIYGAQLTRWFTPRNLWKLTRLGGAAMAVADSLSFLQSCSNAQAAYTQSPMLISHHTTSIVSSSNGLFKFVINAFFGAASPSAAR